MPKKPRSIPKPISLGTVPSREVHLQEIRVLVVDDDDRTRSATVAQLQRDEFQVTAADGITAALESLRRSPVDVVVLDMEMANPAGDTAEAGLVLLRALRQCSPRPQSVVFTPGGSKEHKQAARNLGATAFLTKARDLRDLSLHIAVAWSLDHPLSEHKAGA